MLIKNYGDMKIGNFQQYRVSYYILLYLHSAFPFGIAGNDSFSVMGAL